MSKNKEESTQPNESQEQQESNSWWDKADKKIQIVSPIFIPFVIALTGYFGQKAITEISIQEQNSRLYTELLSRREEAESSLRKDMFKEIMNGFFTEITSTNNPSDLNSTNYNGEDIKDKLSKKILKLEMLALNFGDSLSIGPLFSELSDDIEHVLKANDDVIDNWKVVAAPYQKRLRSLAKRVASRQMSTISAGSQSTDKFEFKITANTQEIRVNEGQSSNTNSFYWSSMDEFEDENKLRLNGVTRFFEITLRDADLVNYKISVDMKILEKPEETNSPYIGSPIVVAHREFSMDFFNFPLIDNTRLSNNHRFALIIEGFDYNTIELKGVLFPGSFASHRDKPFLTDAINELKVNKETN